MDTDFKKLIDNLRIHLNKKINVLGEFTVSDPVKNYARIKHVQGKIGNATAHYEIRKYYKKVFVEIHFEAGSGKSALKDIFHEQIGDNLPPKTKWVDWYDSKSIQYDDGFELTLKDNEKMILEKISERLLYFENSGLANQIRRLL